MRINIVKWNPINDEYGDIRASVFIKPTLELLEFANRNVSNGNRTMMVRISGSGNPIYDGAPFLAILDKTSDAPNCRQNFFNTTGLYLLTLSVRWFGYPENLGEVTFLEGVLGDTFGSVEKNPPISENYENYDNNDDNDDNNDDNDDNNDNNDNNNNNFGNSGVSEENHIRKMSIIGIIVFIVLFCLIMVANVYDNSMKE